MKFFCGDLFSPIFEWNGISEGGRETVNSARKDKLKLYTKIAKMP